MAVLQFLNLFWRSVSALPGEGLQEVIALKMSPQAACWQGAMGLLGLL